MTLLENLNLITRPQNTNYEITAFYWMKQIVTKQKIISQNSNSISLVKSFFCLTFHDKKHWYSLFLSTHKNQPSWFLSQYTPHPTTSNILFNVLMTWWNLCPYSSLTSPKFSGKLSKPMSSCGSVASLKMGTGISSQWATV